MSELKVIPLPASAPNAVAAQLRAIARSIDEGTLKTPAGGIVLLERENGEVDAYGIGDTTDVVRGIGLLHVASFALTRGHDAEIRVRGGEPTK